MVIVILLVLILMFMYKVAMEWMFAIREPSSTARKDILSLNHEYQVLDSRPVSPHTYILLRLKQPDPRSSFK